MTTLHHLLIWLYMNVWGNVVASMFTTVVTLVVGYFKLKKHHEQLHVKAMRNQAIYHHDIQTQITNLTERMSK